MIDIPHKTSLILKIKGENHNLFQINLENSENSTFSENNKNEQNLDFMINSKSSLSKKKILFLNKKRRFNKKSDNDFNAFKNRKNKFIYKLFSEFKSCDKLLYKEFCQFHFIEKNIKKNLYSTTKELASEIRTVFSNIFANFTNEEIYQKIFIFCTKFENLYKKYDNKALTKKCKNLLDLINKLKKELKQTEFYQIQGEYKINKNKDDKYIKNENITNIISNKISKLSIEQKKGIIEIIYNDIIDNKKKEQIIKNNQLNLNINKLSYDKLKQLKKYLNECINYNDSNYTSILEEEKEEEFNNILNNDDLSSCLSDDDEDNDGE